MEMSHNKCLNSDSSLGDFHLLSVVCLLQLFFPGIMWGKTGTCTYFGDSGVKGSGKVVGLAAEHKGAWVIIDLGMTLKAEEKRSTFCNSYFQIGSLNASITTGNTH